MAPEGPRQLRDVALARMLRAKRWILTMSLALTGALAGLAANAFPGKAIKTSASNGTSERGTTESSSSAETPTEGSSGSLSPPEQAPQTTEQHEGEPAPSSAEQSASQPAAEAPVVSGGS